MSTPLLACSCLASHASLIGARWFIALCLANPSPKQMDAYDLDHTIAAKLVTWKALSGHGQV